MGAALALLAAIARPGAVHELILIAPAGLPLEKSLRRSLATFVQQVARRPGIRPRSSACSSANSGSAPGRTAARTCSPRPRPRLGTQAATCNRHPDNRDRVHNRRADDTSPLPPGWRPARRRLPRAPGPRRTRLDARATTAAHDHVVELPPVTLGRALWVIRIVALAALASSCAGGTVAGPARNLIVFSSDRALPPRSETEDFDTRRSRPLSDERRRQPRQAPHQELPHRRLPGRLAGWEEHRVHTRPSRLRPGLQHGPARWQRADAHPRPCEQRTARLVARRPHDRVRHRPQRSGRGRRDLGHERRRQRPAARHANPPLGERRLAVMGSGRQAARLRARDAERHRDLRRQRRRVGPAPADPPAAVARHAACLVAAGQGDRLRERPLHAAGPALRDARRRNRAAPADRPHRRRQQPPLLVVGREADRLHGEPRPSHGRLDDERRRDRSGATDAQPRLRRLSRRGIVTRLRGSCASTRQRTA